MTKKATPKDYENEGGESAATQENNTNVNNEDATPSDAEAGATNPDEAKSENKEPDYQLIIDDLNDKVLRAAAEVQNVRRRAAQDVQKARHFSIESFAKDLLGVMDNLYRAADSVSSEEAAKDERLKAVLDGVEITKKEMLNVFERNHIKRIYPVGEKFDHNLHQAMSQIEDKEKKSGVVVDVIQAGYTINDHLLRPAMVVVTK